MGIQEGVRILLRRALASQFLCRRGRQQSRRRQGRRAPLPPATSNMFGKRACKQTTHNNWSEYTGIERIHTVTRQRSQSFRGANMGSHLVAGTIGSSSDRTHEHGTYGVGDWLCSCGGHRPGLHTRRQVRRMHQCVSVGATQRDRANVARAFTFGTQRPKGCKGTPPTLLKKAPRFSTALHLCWPGSSLCLAQRDEEPLVCALRVRSNPPRKSTARTVAAQRGAAGAFAASVCGEHAMPAAGKNRWALKLH